MDSGLALARWERTCPNRNAIPCKGHKADTQKACIEADIRLIVEILHCPEYGIYHNSDRSSTAMATVDGEFLAAAASKPAIPKLVRTSSSIYVIDPTP